MRVLPALLLLVSAVWPSCSRLPEPRGPWRSVLLVTVDTLRADRLGAYGGDPERTPRLDALAAEGVRFERAYVPLPRTTQSLASLLTGLYPWRHGVRRLGDSLKEGPPTVAERFRAAGYRTGAVVAVPFFLTPQGLDRGFEHFDHFAAKRGADVRAEEVVAHALAWLDEVGDAPFFLWVHFRDPHAPYWNHPEEGTADRLAPPGEGPLRDVYHYWPVDAEGRPVGGRITAAMRERKGRVKFGVERLSDADARRARALYDGEVRWTDRAIGSLLDGLGGRLSSTFVAVTADHGESLGEHDFWFDHGEFLYDVCLRVPLLLRAPGLPAGVVKTPVSTLDLAPTLLELFGLEPIRAPDGRSLAGVLLAPDGPGEPPRRLLFAESGAPLMPRFNPRFAGLDWPGRGRGAPPPDPAWRLRALISPREGKVILDPAPGSGPRLRLFLPDRDPLENEDLAERPDRAAFLERARRALAALAKATARAKPRSAAGDDQWRRLAEQGYLGGSDQGD